jgi:hypothetical protein
MYYRKRWGDVSGLGNSATENGLRRSIGMSPSAKGFRKAIFCKYFLAGEG